MASIKDTLIDKEVPDTFESHWAHQSYHSDCSECYKEKQLDIKARAATRTRLEEELGIDNNYKLRGGMFGTMSPWDRNPLD